MIDSSLGPGFKSLMAHQKEDENPRVFSDTRFFMSASPYAPGHFLGFFSLAPLLEAIYSVESCLESCGLLCRTLQTSVVIQGYCIVPR